MAENFAYVGSPDSSPHSDNESGGHYGGSRELSVREQDRFLPIANVSRIMKRALPANAKISKDAKETVQECVSEFISFVTGEASDKCQREKRKTINGDDLLWAMSTLGFEEYVEPLKLYLHKYRELEGEKASISKQGDPSASDAGSAGLSTMALGMNAGMNGSFAGGIAPGIPTPMTLLQSYVPHQPGMIYGHQMMAPYNTPMPGCGNNAHNSGGHSRGT
eukprot:c27718_g2_i1 orf=890-1549(-)